MVEDHKISKADLTEMRKFLIRVGQTNEDTRYNTDDERIVDSIIALVRVQGKISITEDFDVPYIHPMITIQKWNAELIDKIEELLAAY